MVIYLGVLEKFGRQVQKEYVCKIKILSKELCKSLLRNQARYLKFNIKQGGTERCDVKYKGLVFRIECCSWKFFLSH